MGVLAGLKILEIAALGPVPWCGMLLADMGASVVRVDRPGGLAPQADGDAMKRGRTSVALDLKTPEGRAAALELVAKADVLLEGMRPGAMERLGLGPQECLAVQPALVYARMTGWGQEGPLSQRAGHDINYIALTGALHAIGGERPVLPLNLVGDYGGGGAFLAIGLLAALLDVRRSGRGHVLDVAMVDGAASLMTLPYARLPSGAWRDARGQNMLDGGAPWYDVYATRDGKFMAVGAIEPQFYAELLQGLGLPAEGIPDRSDRAHWPLIRQRFTEAFLGRSRDDWAAHFAGMDACVSPVLSLAEAPHHPHHLARQTFQRWDGHAMPGAAPRFDAGGNGITGRSASADLAQVLAQWGPVPD